ncbi:phosphotransferase enzyme family protein [Kribbella jejuensis]|uniref:phosphotransferase enzyme family protein n=1 Tax=Kribbella jejuensis TaxID=236068 RepID=UPI00192D9AE7|nr:phosphotransferase [Kribbella jejuensis]
MDDEEVLTGGNVADVVVRIGSTVRKPAMAHTAGVEAVLEHLKDFEASPQTLGRDEQGRHVLEYIPGTLADTLPPLTIDELHRIGRLIRELHDAMETFEPPPDAEWHPAVPDPAGGDLILHGDLAPWNLVRTGDRWVFIDWDNCGPSTRLWDLGYAAQTLVPLLPWGDVTVDAPRLRAFADGYDLTRDQRVAFPAQIAARTRGSYDLLLRGHQTGEQPWAKLYEEGHANFWRPAAAYTTHHHDDWLEALIS